MPRMSEQDYLRYWAGTSPMPALMVWGMRHGTFDPLGTPHSVDEIARATGYTRQQVYDMLSMADSMIVKRETDNEIPDIPHSNGR